MKNTIKLVTLFIFLITFSSCDEDIADVNFTTSLSENIEIHIGQTQEYVSDSMILKLDNADTHNYLDKIKSLKTTKLTYQVIDFTGAENGYINTEFSANNNVLTMAEFNVKSAFDNETIYEITDVDKLNAIANSLKNDKEVNFKIEGECFASSDVDFKLKITAEVKIVANPL